MLHHDAASEQGIFGANLAPPRVPGYELADLIHSLHVHDRRPAWRVGAIPDHLPSLVVPRLRGWKTSRVFRPRLALALESQHEIAFEQLQSHDVVEWRRLHLAGLRDIVGFTYDELTDAATSDDRSVRRAVSAGRTAWARANAWPWACFENGKPPPDFASCGGGSPVDNAFQRWTQT